MPPERRASDPRVDQLVTDMTSVKAALDLNTVVTLQVKEILDGFRTAAKVIKFVLKWATIIGSAVAACVAAMKGLRA